MQTGRVYTNICRDKQCRQVGDNWDSTEVTKVGENTFKKEDRS